MNKLKKEKGITLVALIITIVVLLILAIVSIGAVKDSGIIAHAQNAVTDYNAKQKEEEGLLAQYETLLDEQMGIGPWKVQEDGTIKNGKTGDTVEIGDELDNDDVLAKAGGTKSSYTGTWTILGVKNGRLKLVSTTNVGSSVILGYYDPGAIAAVTVEDESSLTEEELKELKLERSVWSYNHAMDTIKTAVKTATGITSAESITIEDIENVLNITEEQKRTLNSSYGRTYRYYYEGDAETGKLYSQYLDWNETDTEAEDTTEEGWSNGSKGQYNIFISYDKVIDGTDANKNNVIKLKCNSYNYIDAFTDTKFASSLGTGNYWLASPYVEDFHGTYAFFRVHRLLNGQIGGIYLFRSYGDPNFSSFGVRAVVYI